MPSIKDLTFLEGQEVNAPDESVSIEADQYIYIGDKDTDGSYRYNLDTGVLKIEQRISAAWVEQDRTKFNKIDAVVPPTVDNDIDENYVVGSWWIDITNDFAYICLDNTDGAAVWLNATLSYAKQNATTSNPAAGNDNTEGYAVNSIWTNTTTDISYLCADATTGAAVWNQVIDGTNAQTIAGNKTFSNNVNVGGNVIITGDLTVNGTTTNVNTTDLEVKDKNITINHSGDDASSEGAGITVERTGVDGSIVYEDALNSKFKAGAKGSEIELANISGAQTLTNKTIDYNSNTIQNLPSAGAVEIEDEGSSLTVGVTKINFVGAGVTATEPVANQIDVTIPGGGGGTAEIMPAPVNNIPADEATDQVLTVNLFSGEYLNAYFYTGIVQYAHAATDWEVRRTSDSVIVFQSLNDTVNLTSIVVDPAIAASTEYEWRYAYRDAAGNISDYSSYTQFTTSTRYVDTPVFSYPTGNPLDVKFTIPFAASAFSVVNPIGGETHAASQWQIATDAGFTNIVFDSGDDTVNLTSIELDSDNFTVSTAYHTRVRYKEATVGYGAWSVVQQFSTDSAFDILPVLSVGSTASPYIHNYNQDGTTFTYLNSPTGGDLPTSSVVDIAYMDGGEVCALGTQSTPFLSIYSRSQGVYTFDNNPSTLPSVEVRAVSASPDGTYLAVCHDGGDGVIIYKRSGTTFTALAGVPALTSTGRDISWTPDSVGVSFAIASSPYIQTMSRVGDTFSTVGTVDTDPTALARGIDYSSDGNYMAVSGESVPGVVYAVTGTTLAPVFTKQNMNDIQAGHLSTSIALSSDGGQLYVGSNTNPYLYLYTLSGTTYTIEGSAVNTVPGGTVDDLDINADDAYLSVCSSGSPYLQVYSVAATTLTKILGMTNLPTNYSTATRFLD